MVFVGDDLLDVDRRRDFVGGKVTLDRRRPTPSSVTNNNLPIFEHGYSGVAARRVHWPRSVRSIREPSLDVRFGSAGPCFKFGRAIRARPQAISNQNHVPRLPPPREPYRMVTRSAVQRCHAAIFDPA